MVAVKFFQVITQVEWLNSEQTNMLKTISVLILRVVMWLGIQSIVSSHVTTLRMRTVLETLVCSPFNRSTWLITQKNFTQIKFLQSAAAYTLMVHKKNGDIREELNIFSVNTGINRKNIYRSNLIAL
jgi:F420-0:gamma-glutamyl ligase